MNVPPTMESIDVAERFSFGDMAQPADPGCAGFHDQIDLMRLRRARRTHGVDVIM
jgi:hypothetical protein